MKLECNLVKAVSKKSGNEYYRFEIILPNGYKKVVFPEYSETYILDTVYYEK